ncbi:MAG TPA: hypothetical protein VEL79_03235 [Vicinamibacterales bacterium]|nr:hypothetical protein [Vicinamibacterales bacterium]
MRRTSLLAALVLAGSCAGAPTSPSISTLPTGVLPNGAYTLTMGHSMIFSCQNGICTAVSLCVGPAGAPSSASFSVIVHRDGDRAVVMPVSAADSFRMSLQVASSTVSGSISGTMSNADGVTVVGSGTAIGSASALTGTVQGAIDGELTIGGASCSNVTYNWALAPR